MADFRKCVFAFAVLALLLGSAGTANAQQQVSLQCIANAGVPPLMRSEGITELIGDIVLNCTSNRSFTDIGAPSNPIPGAAIPAGVTLPSVNIRVFLNTAVTSRLISPDPWSEALLLIGEPNPAGPFQGCVQGATQLVAPAVACNVIQGRVVGGNSVEFIGVPVLPPGTNQSTVYRITNVRANASAVAPGGSGTPGQVVALISATPATQGAVGATPVTASFPINNPQQIVGFVQNGLTFSVRNDDNDDALSTSFGFQQCVSRSRGSSGLAVLRYAEGFPTAFKVRTSQTVVPPASFDAALPVTEQNVPGFIYNTESGYYNPSGFTAGTGTSTLTSAGLADFSTRLRALFTNVPAGVRLFVTVREVASAGGNTARLVGSAVGAFFPVTALSDLYGDIAGNDYAAAEVTIVNGTGEAVWEIMSADPLANGRVDFGLFATYTSDVANNLPAGPSQATVSGSFAPVTGPTTASLTAPIPRFVDLSTGRNLFRVNICVTNLLFPFITNQAGFDTGLAIANTSQDPFGTAAQAGTCTLNWYGANAPAAAPTPSVAAGTVWVNTVMNLAPNFQGYMIAQCRFQFAHGFAFISDVGARNLAMGYLALVIPADADADRDADPFPNGGAGSGEQLGN